MTKAQESIWHEKNKSSFGYWSLWHWLIDDPLLLICINPLSCIWFRFFIIKMLHWLDIFSIHSSPILCADLNWDFFISRGLPIKILSKKINECSFQTNMICLINEQAKSYFPPLTLYFRQSLPYHLRSFSNHNDRWGGVTSTFLFRNYLVFPCDWFDFWIHS